MDALDVVPSRVHFRGEGTCLHDGRYGEVEWNVRSTNSGQPLHHSQVRTVLVEHGGDFLDIKTHLMVDGRVGQDEDTFTVFRHEVTHQSVPHIGRYQSLVCAT
ncbi:hypothetical protein D3C84_801520 [compost metagenome]